MRGTLKLLLPLTVSVAVGCLFFAAYQVHAEKRILRGDLLHHAETIGTSLRDAIEPLLDRQPDGSIQHFVERVGVREHLKGVVVYDSSGTVLASARDR
jgi:hypothetical protein